MTKKALMFFAALLTGETALASNWVSIAKVNNKEFLIDTPSIKVTGNVRKAWVKIVYPSHSYKLKPPGSGFRYVNSDISHLVFNCNEETVSTEALTLYYEDGGNWSTTPNPSMTAFVPVTPDTPLANEMTFVCAF